MGIFDKLDSFIKIPHLSLKNVKFITFNVNSNNKSVNLTANKVLVIDPTKLGDKERSKASDFVREFVDQGGYVIEDKSQKLLEDFKKVDQKEENQRLIAFFTNKIPPDDIEALRASLYIRSIRKSPETQNQTDILKRDITQRFGRRGARIANICTAGYFEDLIKPLYEEMEKQDDFTLDKFKSKYDTIIMQTPFAVFANRIQSQEDLRKEILEKILRNRKYGIHRLNIHAIGKENVIKIEGALQDIRKEITNIETDSTEGYITVKITF